MVTRELILEKGINDSKSVMPLNFIHEVKDSIFEFGLLIFNCKDF